MEQLFVTENMASKKANKAGQHVEVEKRFRLEKKDHFHEMYISGCRLYYSVTNKSTFWNNFQAHKKAQTKIKAWQKDGYALVECDQTSPFDTSADIIATLAKVHSHVGAPLFPYVAHATKPNVFQMKNVWGEYFMVCSEDRRKGIQLSTPELLDPIRANMGAIFSSGHVPIQKSKLERPIGNHTHLAIVSPQVHDTASTLGRSIWKAFVCFDQEFSGAENVCTADARLHGHGAFVTGAAHAHPVVDMCFGRGQLESPESIPDEEFKVFVPRELSMCLQPLFLAKPRFDWVVARNFKLERVGVHRDDTSHETLIDQLKKFFHFDEAPALAKPQAAY
jgi:hypothetical protein